MGKFWTIQAAANDPKTGELFLYGNLGPDDGLAWMFDEVTPKQFKDDLDGLGDISELRVMINSDGGDVFAGQAIHSMLVRHPAHVTVYIDGLAASIASIVAMAGDTVIMPRNAMMMIHDPWAGAIGNAREFRKLADTLDSIRESMIAAYNSKTGIERSELIRLLNAETWMTAAQAVELGFADEIEEKKAIAASLVKPGIVSFQGREFDLTYFNNAPDFSEEREVPKEKPTKREIERALRDVGLSQSAAKAFVARGFQEEPSRDVPEIDTVTQAEAERLRFESDRLLARVQRQIA